MSLSYDVVFEDCDTRICPREDHSGEYETYQEAMAAAVEYLEDLIASCRETLDGTKKADRLEG